MAEVTTEATTLVVPLRKDEDGVLRVGETRLTLETVVHAFHQGRAPEEIARSFDTLSLADVYAIVSYYLQHRAALDEYLRTSRAGGGAAAGD